MKSINQNQHVKLPAHNEYHIQLKRDKAHDRYNLAYNVIYSAIMYH